MLYQTYACININNGNSINSHVLCFFWIGATTTNDVKVDEIQKGEHERVTVNFSHQCGAGGD